MPLRDCPFQHDQHPLLDIRIINPHNGRNYRTYGIIDTGASECAVPADFARILGHDLQSGITKTVYTGNGPTTAYAHSTVFEIFHPVTGKLVYTVPNTPIDFMPNLNVVLMGVNSFLSRFILKIDYPRKVFPITLPR